ncbi:MAG: sugar kinase, partial [Spirochaetales bacterium]|nr:sugar kinase [Spirochaetales bacterium]
MKKFENRIVIITRATRLENVLAAQNTLSQAKFYVSQLGGDFDEYEQEHNQYGLSVKNARRDLETLGNIQLLDRKYLPNFIFAPDDMVVVIGQDGLVANTIKYLDYQPVIGVNPDAARWDGVLLPFKPEDAARIVEETVAGKRKIEEVTMARVRVQNGQELLAVNDFFIGQKTHTSARYIIKYGGLREPQSSSGVIVSTGLGSTGWMKSIIAGANRIASSVIGRPYGG